MSPVHVIMCKGLNQWSLFQVTTPYALTHMRILYHRFLWNIQQNIMMGIIVYLIKVDYIVACTVPEEPRLC